MPGELGKRRRGELALALEQRSQDERHRQRAALAQRPYELRAFLRPAVGRNRGERSVTRLARDLLGTLFVEPSSRRGKGGQGLRRRKGEVRP